MWQAHPTWGSPRIVGELRKLGIAVATSTVEKDRLRPTKPPSPTWKTLLKNPIQDLVGLDCFTVPTVTYKVLCGLVILAHARRRVVHFHVTAHPTAVWTAQQVVEACPWEEAPRSLLRDRIDGTTLQQRVTHMGSTEVVRAARSPWQHPSVERLIGLIRRECLHQVVICHARHLTRLLTRYCASYHGWRTHRSLARDGPEPRPVHGPDRGQVIAVPEVGGL
jgi:putative transposase